MNHMSNQLQTQIKTKPQSFLTPLSAGLLQRTCACGGTPGVDGECEECREKRLSLQSSPTQPAASSQDVPPVVHEVLGATGQPLDARTRAFMEPRFGHDFSNIRVHTDAKAAESAQAVNALAYTVGRDVVFGAGQYAPGTSEGKKLMAHELTHTIQQAGMQRIPSKPKVTDSNIAAENQAETAANTLVGQHSLLSIRPQLQRKENKAKATKGLSQSYFIDNEGYIYVSTASSAVGQNEQFITVGYQETGGSYVTVDKAGTQSVSFTEAKLGTLTLPTFTRSILRVNKVMTQKVQASSSQAPSADVEGDQLTPLKVTCSGSQLGILFDEETETFGDEILKKGAKWEPIQFEQLSSGLQKKLKETSEPRINLDDGSLWVLMTFRLRNESQETARWVPPGHSKREYQKKEQRITEVAEKLPAELKEQLDEYIKAISLVSTVEGSFGATSPKTDIYASLGIFQWAMPKHKTGESGSLGKFFGDLKRRAEQALAVKDMERTDEQKLYIDAWTYFKTHGLDINAKGQITLNGQLATGEQVESTFHVAMGKEDILKRYQLVAAKDWIEQFKETVVRPGVVGASLDLIGNHYKENNAVGTEVTLKWNGKSGEYTFKLIAPKDHATVGSLFTSEKSIAIAVVLGVNRPHYVETALWRALNPKMKPKEWTGALLENLGGYIESLSTQEATSSKQKGGKKDKPVHKTTTDADVSTWDDEHKEIYESLRRIIWPQAGELDETELANEFKRQAMPLYKPADAKKYHRERRFTTVETA